MPTSRQYLTITRTVTGTCPVKKNYYTEPSWTATGPASATPRASPSPGDAIEYKNIMTYIHICILCEDTNECTCYYCGTVYTVISVVVALSVVCFESERCSAFITNRKKQTGGNNKIKQKYAYEDKMLGHPSSRRLFRWDSHEHREAKTHA